MPARKFRTDFFLKSQKSNKKSSKLLFLIIRRDWCVLIMKLQYLQNKKLFFLHVTIIYRISSKNRSNLISYYPYTTSRDLQVTRNKLLPAKNIYLLRNQLLSTCWVLPRAFYWLNINARGAWCTWCHLWRESLVNFQRRLSRSCVWETVDGMWQKGQGRTRVKWVETRRDGSTSPDQSVAPQQPFVRPLETERLRGGETD